MVGAPLLCGLGALRIGAGLVTIASSPEVIEKLEKRVLEIMTLGLEGNDFAVVETLTKFISDRRVSVLVAGPGFDPRHVRVLKSLLQELSIPVVLDAGALTCFTNELDDFKKITSINPKIIGTPHAGEFRAFSGIALSDDIDERKAQVGSVSIENQFTIVSKGSSTLVASSNGDLYVNETGNPGLATAGTGDVLAGVIAGLLAQGFDVEQSCQAGVYLHGLAGDMASEEKTQPGLIASDLGEFLPKALAKVRHSK